MLIFSCSQRTDNILQEENIMFAKIKAFFESIKGLSLQQIVERIKEFFIMPI